MDNIACYTPLGIPTPILTGEAVPFTTILTRSGTSITQTNATTFTLLPGNYRIHVVVYYLLPSPAIRLVVTTPPTPPNPTGPLVLGNPTTGTTVNNNPLIINTCISVTSASTLQVINSGPTALNTPVTDATPIQISIFKLMTGP